MIKRDVLDKTLAQRFAWRILSPTDIAEVTEKPLPAEEATKEPSPQARAVEERLQRQGDQARDVIAKETVRVWYMTPPIRQAAAALKLLRRADALGLELAGMDRHPRESLLLWRLAVRYYDRLPGHVRKSLSHSLGFLSVPPDPKDAAELLIDVAEKGNTWLAFMLEMGGAASEATGRRHPDLGRRLAHILDEGETWASREIAAQWLGLAEFRDAIPSLRRALRLPHARVRWCALEALLTKAPLALTEDDVEWLLEDAVKHPMPCSYGTRLMDTIYGYADALVTALTKVRPAEGFRPLESIANGECVHAEGTRMGLDEGWAVRALAAGYPERSLARIDDRLYGRASWLKRDAVEAAALLPEDLARPRLLAAAAGTPHYAAERAKEVWFKRFGEVCPVSMLAGVEIELLSGKPSDLFLSRLAVLRGSSEEAEGAMLRSLLAETPPRDVEGSPAAKEELTAAQRETLVLLLFSLRDRRLSPADLPTRERDWAREMVGRFGDAGLEGLARLALHSKHPDASRDWLGALADMARDGLLTASQRDRLREVAGEVLRSQPWIEPTGALIALRQVGAPPEFGDRLWSVLLAPLTDHTWANRWSSHAAYWAVDVLVGMKEAPTLDARIAEEVARALRERDYVKLEQIIAVGCRRGVPCALDVATRCIDAVDDEPESFQAAMRCGYALEEANVVTEEWLLGLLVDPASLRFTIGARLARRVPQEPGIRAAVSSVLDSPARGGVAAAEAAASLLWMEALGVDDARLEGVLARAPAPARASLIGSMLLKDAPLALVERHAAELVVGTDEKVALEVLEDLTSRQPAGTSELLEAALARGPLPSVREGIEEHLGKVTEAELYWRDSKDSDGEGEDEDEEGGDEDDDNRDLD